MIGESASKKASASSPETCWMAAASAGEVSGPVATTTLSQSSGGRPATSPRSTVISGSADSASSTAAAKPWRSTAKALPAGTRWASATRMTSEPARRISSCNNPTALAKASSERNEFEQTSSHSRSVTCAAVPRPGRISCSTAGTPARATCHAASQPASPPPMTWIGEKPACDGTSLTAGGGFTPICGARRGHCCGAIARPTWCASGCAAPWREGA